MNYTEQLAKAKEMNINICELTIAWEVESAYAPTDPRFERICQLTYDYWLSSEYATLSQIVYAIKRMLEEKGFALNEINKYNICDYIEW